MISDEQVKIQNLRKNAKIFSGVFASTVLYLVYIARMGANGHGDAVPLADAVNNPMVLILGLGALSSATFSFVVKFLLNPKAPPMGTQPVDSLARAMVFMRNHILCYALSEAVGTFGFVLALQTKCFEIGIPFFAASALLFVIHWPKTDTWK